MVVGRWLLFVIVCRLLLFVVFGCLLLLDVCPCLLFVVCGSLLLLVVCYLLSQKPKKWTLIRFFSKRAQDFELLTQVPESSHQTVFFLPKPIYWDFYFVLKCLPAQCEELLYCCRMAFWILPSCSTKYQIPRFPTPVEGAQKKFKDRLYLKQHIFS